MRKLLLFSVLLMLISLVAHSQAGVLDPNDPIVNYNPAAPPATPPNGTMVKWVKTNRVSFTTTSFKSYFYKGMAFRLKFPKSYQHNVSDGKTYPVFVFFHGIGERGSIYDNEYQLFHGGQLHRDAVDNGQFDGFLLYPQSSDAGGQWSAAYFAIVKEVIENYLVPQVKADINRIIIDGLSGGGSATWQFTRTYPNLVAAALPISAPVNVPTTTASIPQLKFTPIWTFQGGLDDGPTPFTTESLVNAYKAQGANITYTLYPTQGHGCWYSAWGESNYFPYISKAHKANPWPLNGRTEYCLGDNINAVIGVTPGFTGYQWRKNGVVIPGATSNQITITDTGTYDCRILRGSTWSVWSPIPVKIVYKGATIPPPISIEGLMSKAIPALDGKNSVTLSVPEGYATYQWRTTTSSTILGTSNTFVATSPGNYIVRVTEQYGCSSDFSAPFTVINSNGPNRPTAPSGVLVSTISKTQLRVDWADNSSDETAFEIYQALQPGGPYQLAGVTGPNQISYTVNGLNAKTKYYFVVRAIGTTSASVASNEASATTDSDNTAPSAPSNLTITGTTRYSVALSWGASTDDVGVTQYDVFVNGVKSYVTTETSFVVYNLNYNTPYNFVVKAKDAAGNISTASNQVTGIPRQNGLNYKYYTFTGTWNNLPDFNTLSPDATGIMPNIALTPRTQDDNFAFLWEGFITIPTTGTYYFRTNSDDGSRLWLGSLNGTTSPYSYSATPVVNNDGLHGAQNVTSSARTLTAGVYPIAIAFYEQGGGESMTVSWRTPSSGSSYVTIPNSAFQDPQTSLGNPPNAPSNGSATAISYKQINVSWNDNSNNETGFEIWRSTNVSSGYVIAGTTAANATSFVDSVGLDPSTTYYYRIRAIGQYGESSFIPGNIDAQAQWNFNNNYSDSSPNSRTLSANSSPSFSTDAKEGSHSIDLNGSNQDLTINTSSGDYLRGSYNAKTIAFWMKADNTSSNRGVFDIGGSDNGLAMYINANTLYAGVASGNTRRSISTAYNSTAWNFITLVYSTNTLRLYVNGTQVASNTSLGFNSVGSTSNASMIGDDNGTNAFNTSFGQFDGHFDNFTIFGRALSVAEISALMNGTYGLISATTGALPSLPSVPTGLVASGASTSTINITWNDISTNESGYQLYRSANNNVNYVLLVSLPADANSYVDTALNANSIFYYKVRAFNDAGYTNFSSEDSAITYNNVPVITPIANQYMRYDTQLNLNIAAEDSDGDNLSVSFANLPAFASFVPNAQGGVLTLAPGVIGNVGNYTNIIVTVTDVHGAEVSTSFNLYVNDNHKPAIGSISNVALDENTTAQKVINASDANAGDVLIWTFTGLPSFVTPVINDRSVQLNIAPGYADFGSYFVTVKVDDGNTGTDTSSFTITVNDVNPSSKIYVNFTSASYLADAPWNNTAKTPAAGDIFSNLKNDEGVSTSVGLQLMNTWQGLNTVGANTGNNSGVYPDNVLRTSYYTNTTVQNVKVFGLNVNSKYKFTFLGSRYTTGPLVTIYSIGSESVSLDAAGNYLNTVSIENVQPQADGTITFTVQKAAGMAYGYLNSLVIETSFDDGSNPATPRNLAGEFVGNAINLTWLDAAFNETGYEVYRASQLNGPYTLLNNGGTDANVEQYSDATVSGNKTYYYTVRAIKGAQFSAFSDTIAISTPNTSPLIAAIADVTMNTGAIQNVNVSATDDPGDVITFALASAPPFVSLSNNGNGTATIQIQPGTAAGAYSVTVTATDNGNASSSATFNVAVIDPGVSKAFVNFNQQLPAASPWNNFNSAPNAGVAINNIVDQGGTATGINVTLVGAWSAATTNGTNTGNNSGVYPDNVIRSSYYGNIAGGNVVRLSGLSTSKKYNLVFFASRASTGALVTRYSADGKSADLSVDNNTTQTVTLSDISPTAGGIIDVTVTKVGSSAYYYLGAMEIESYPFTATALPPTNVTASALSRTSIKLNWTNAGSAGTAYEIWRSTSYNGTYTKVADVPVSSITYTNTGLSAATVYYYKIRTVVSPGVYTAYSNIASASTVSYTVNINLNGSVATAQIGGWNNTNTVFTDGFVLPNLINSDNQPTGINMNTIRAFGGHNEAYGLTTGNNSGVVPDKVMSSFYYSDFADTAKLSISNLNQASVYNFIFYAGSSFPQTNSTVYKIGDQTASLGSTNNYTNVAKIYNVRPDSTGTVYITVYSSVGYAFLNSISLEAMPDVAPEGGQQIAGRAAGNTSQAGQANTATSSDMGSVANRSAISEEVDNDTKVTISAYPNPFINDVTVELKLNSNVSKINVALLDMSGRRIYNKDFSNVSQGVWKQRLGLNGGTLPKGIYLIQVTGVHKEKIVTRIVKY